MASSLKPRQTRLAGRVPARRNVVSGNGDNGVRISDVSDNIVIGNYIGTNAAGNMTLPNRIDGVEIVNGASNNAIGGDKPAHRNVISGNGRSGISIADTGTMNNRVSGNYIGTDASGTKALGNERNGISIRDGAQNNPVGGSSVAERNLVSGNERNGVEIAGTDTMSNTVSANYIGTDVTGTEALGNERDGVHISSSAQNNRVGGSDVAERNLISGNGRVGISINGRDDGTNSNNIQGNYIGVNMSGKTSSIANGTADEYTAIEIDDSANNTVTKNLVSGNIGSGILIQGDTSTGNSILANYIGTDKTGTERICQHRRGHSAGKRRKP